MTHGVNHSAVSHPETAPVASAPRPGLARAGAPTVSFITPAYNASATLDATVRSVLEQTAPSWEMLIVDDGSSDDTLAKAQAWAERDPRVHVFAKTNGGPADARNFGLARASGAWLVFLDADDWLAPTFLSEMLAHVEGADVLLADHARVDAGGEEAGVVAAPALPDPFATLARRCPIVPVAAMVRSEIAHRIGGFDPTVISSEDWQFWQRAARLGARFKRVPRRLSYYRMQPGSLSRRTERDAPDALRVIDEAFSGLAAAGDAADAREAKAGYLLYAAVLAACGDGDPAAVLARAPDLADWSFDPGPWGVAIADLAAYAAARARSEVPALWPVIEPRLERFYDALRDVMAAPQHAARLRLHVQAQVFGAAAPAITQAARDGAHLVALDVAAPRRSLRVEAHADVDTLVIAAHARGRVVGVVEAPVAALADDAGWRPIARTLALRAPLKPALSGLADGALAAAFLRALADFGGWTRAGDARRMAWAIATRALARRLSGAPLAVGAPPLAVLLLRDRSFSASDLPSRLAALAARGVELMSGADAATLAARGHAPVTRRAVLAIDGLALGSGHPAFASAPPSATVFAPAGPAGHALRAEARSRSLRLGLRCVPEEAIARQSAADAVAWFAQARAEIDDPAPGVLFAPGDVDAVTRWAARRAGFAFGVNPEPDVADFAQDPLSWRRLEMRAHETAATLAARIGAL